MKPTTAFPHYEEKIMRTSSKNYPDWVEDLSDDNKAQPGPLSAPR